VGKVVAVIEEPHSRHCRDAGIAVMHRVVAYFADIAEIVRAAHVDVVDSERQKFQGTADRNHYLPQVDTGDDSLDNNNAVRADTESAVAVAVVAAAAAVVVADTVADAAAVKRMRKSTLEHT
jgi:hypothetical protein